MEDFGEGRATQHQDLGHNGAEGPLLLLHTYKFVKDTGHFL